MAAKHAARNHGEGPGHRPQAPGPRAAKAASAVEGGRELDGLVHERIRLGILCALAVNPSLSFNELKVLLDTTPGNLSVHGRKLEEAGYVSCRKFFEDRTPRTEFKITAAGRRALERYLAHMESLIAAVKDR